MALDPAALGAARAWAPRSVPRGSVAETAQFLLKQQTRLERANYHWLRCPRLLSNGVPPNAMSGDIKAAATTQTAEKKVKVTRRLVGGLTTSQVNGNCFPLADNNYSGKTCPHPGSLPHGNWTCETQEIPIHGTSFLEEDAQSYPGELAYF